MNKEEWDDILYAARMMLLTRVCEKIEAFFQELLSACKTHLFFRIKKLASRFDLEKLDNFCDEFGPKYLFFLKDMSEFGGLEFDYILFLLSYSNVSEDLKMNCLLEWIKFDVEDRRQYISKICEAVDVEKLSTTLCKDLVENEPLCYGCAEFMEAVNGCKQEICTCIDTIRETLMHGASLLRHASDDDSSSTSAIVLFNTMHECLISYQPSTHKWYKEFALPKHMVSAGHYTAVVVDNYLYALLPDGKLCRIPFFNGDVEWEELETSLQSYAQNICAAACGEAIYVSGGYQMGCFNIAKMKWEKFDKGPAESVCSTLVECDDHIYSIGGGICTTTNSVYKYNPRSKTWSSVACMNVARGASAAICHAKKLYVAGRYNNGLISSTERYCPATDTWTLLSSMKTPRSYFKLVVADDKIFVIGYNDVEVYDEIIDKWNYHCKHPFPVGLQCSATVAVDTLTHAGRSLTSHSNFGERLCQKRSRPKTEEDVTPNKRIST